MAVGSNCLITNREIRRSTNYRLLVHPSCPDESVSEALEHNIGTFPLPFYAKAENPLITVCLPALSLHLGSLSKGHPFTFEEYWLFRLFSLQNKPGKSSKTLLTLPSLYANMRSLYKSLLKRVSICIIYSPQTNTAVFARSATSLSWAKSKDGNPT